MREAIFNSLQSLVDLDGADVADVFAGTGALGIEALSRGARTCVFVERDRDAVDAIRRNLATTKLDGGRVVHADALRWVATHGNRFDVAFADPPYDYHDWAVIGGLDADVLVVESDREVDVGAHWAVQRTKRYGTTVVTLFVPRRPM